MASLRVLIYLLRRDLRLADNPVFDEVARLSQQPQCPFTHLLPVYVFPAQQIEVSGFLSSADERCPFPEARSQLGGFWRCGPMRAKFLAESAWDLKSSLKHVGRGLTIRVGLVGQTGEALLRDLNATGESEVYGVRMKSEEASEVSSLVTPLESMPMLKTPPPRPSHTQSAHPFEGGSSSAHDRLEYLISSGSMTHYNVSRNGLLGTDFSTKLSAWLALGCMTA